MHLSFLVLALSCISSIASAQSYHVNYDSIPLDEDRVSRMAEKKSRRLTNEQKGVKQESLIYGGPLANALPQEHDPSKKEDITQSPEFKTIELISRYVSKQEKAIERHRNNYGMDGDAIYSLPPPDIQPRKKRSFIETGKPDFWTQAHTSFKPPVHIRSDVRHMRHMRGLAALRDYSLSQVHDWFFWVFTGVWVVMGSAFVYAVMVID
ncbi:hypothetical protein BDR26DRAFT_869091 [Obelidium mucronatum]|nr:hypothetical protein BDR26DRAFT_869091 [Obelidium mucronatum]